MKSMVWPLLLVTIGWSGELYYYNNGKPVGLTPIEGVRPKEAGAALYRTDKGEEVAVAARVIARFSPDADVESLARRHGLEVVKAYTFEGMYLLKAPSPEAAIRAANALREEPGVLFAQPDVGRQRRVR